MDYQTDLKNAAEALRNGGLILYPTDTIWSVGCDATNVEAVKKVYDLTGNDNPDFSVLVENEVRLSSYVVEVPEMAYDLIELSDKPLTIIYPKRKNLANNLPGDDGSIAIRVTTEPFSRALCQKFRKPLVSMPAQISGGRVPNNFGQIDDQLLKEVDYIVHYRQDDNSEPQPSGILKLDSDGQVKVIRE